MLINAGNSYENGLCGFIPGLKSHFHASNLSCSEKTGANKTETYNKQKNLKFKQLFKTYHKTF